MPCLHSARAPHCNRPRAQGWPDAVNMYWYPQCVLRPGETYRQRTVWRFYNAAGAGEAWGAS